MLTIRAARWPDDISALAAIDTSFLTDRIYRVSRDELSFCLTEEAGPLHKRYEFRPDDRAERESWNCAIVAEHEGAVAGFTAAEYQEWNRRLVICHLYVESRFRGAGVGRRMIGEVDEFGRSVGARCLWLETQNVNFPAIQFYRRAGFQLCGLDESLYDQDSSDSDEVALFFTRAITVMVE